MPRGARIPFDHLVSQVHPDDAPILRGAYDQARDPATRGRMDAEYRVLPQWGAALRWIRIRGRGVFDADGAAGGRA